MVKTQGEAIAKVVERMDKSPEKPHQQRQRKSPPKQEDQHEQHQQQPQTDASRKSKKRECSESASQTDTGSTQDPPYSEDNAKWETAKSKSMQKKKKKERKRLEPRTRSDVFIVKAGVIKYSEMLKKIKNGKEVQSLGDSISAVSETRSGHLRVVLNRKASDTEELSKAITRAIGDETICTKLTDSIRIEIRDVDEEATEEEIVQAILKSTELSTSATVLHTRKAGRGTKIVTVSVPTSTAHTLASTRLRVGYVNCRVRRKIELQVPRLQAGIRRRSKENQMNQFLQINLHCAKATQDLMCQYAAEEAIDYIFVSEYNNLGNQHWYPDNTGKAAIVCNPSNPITDIGQSENGFRWIEVDGMTLYSCYWSPNTSLQEFKQFLSLLETDALKIIAKRQPEMLLEIYNKCLEEGRFPTVWKRARLVLIKKGDKPPLEPASYRPLCLIDCTGKLFEKIIDNRVRDFLKSGTPSGLSENQFGFRSKRSTTDALAVVCKAAEDVGPRKETGMLSLDVQNAFNSAPWDKILEAMKAKKLPTYLCQLVDNYLWDRTLYTQDQSGTEVPMQLSSGVPQGSVLGPTLWNILYDDLLRVRLPGGARYLAFADDVAIIAQATDTIGLKNILQIAAEKTRDWMQNIGLHLALQKTEMLVITKTRTRNELEIEIDGNAMLAEKELKYLGIRLDQKLRFTAYARTTCEKASRAVQNLSRILPNVSAAKQAKRMLMSNVVHSMLLYGAPVWANKMSKKGLSELAKVQRRIALMVASAYRTSSTDAVLVITGIPPIDLQALKRKAIYDNRLRPETGEVREEAESMLNRTWQGRWDSDEAKGRWTHKI
ncbi:hypothetical protein QTP88_020856 [Uroleucon formosanum]